ncbi:MAG: putative toxin-antitoxin system toxin component, PIN family [Nitrospirota bacterium]
MFRVVLDTNIIVSGTIQGRGNPFLIMEEWRKGHFLLITSEALVEEVERVLSYPRIQEYGVTSSQIQGVIRVIRRYGISTPGKFKVSDISEDPSDNQVLSAAIEGNADYIVSGDQHLQKFRRYKGIAILTLREFLDILKT